MTKRNLQLLVILVLFLSATLPAPAAYNERPTQTYLQRLRDRARERVIVVFQNDPDPHLLAKHHAKLIRKLKTLNAFVCEIDRGVMELLKRQDNIKDVVPDALVRIPRRTRPVRQPSIKLQEKVHEMTQQADIGQPPVEWNCLEAGLNAQAAWNKYDLDGSGIKIAFIDSGVNYTLPDIDNNYLGGDDMVDADEDPFTDNMDENHATMVVSTAVGEGQSQVVGVAPNAGYYVLRVLDASGTGLVSDIIAAIEWATQEPHKADIISMSLGTYGGGPGWQTLRTQWQSTCNAAYDAGIILVAASGNEGYPYSAWPAAFTSVVSAGAHGEQQLVWNDIDGASNGAVDLVAPGVRVPAIAPDNSAWWVCGTSFAAPHVAGLVALELQYATQNSIELNSGYLWEVTRHSAIDLGTDHTYQGKGKAWAARTDTNDTNLGSIDLIASNWPISYEFHFSDYAFAACPECNRRDGTYPAYYIGTDVNQSITLTNVTNMLGNCPENIENLSIAATHTYYGDPNDPNLPGSATAVFPTVTLLEPGDANSITLSLLYTVPSDIYPGLNKTKLAFQFNFVQNNRILSVCYHEPNSLWYAAMPGDLNLDNDIDLMDFSSFARHWQHTGCDEPDFCGRADIDNNGTVDWQDLHIFTESWLSTP